MGHTVLVIMGTRPEAIKLAPLVLELKRRENFRTLVCATAQHRSMLDDVLQTFNLRPDFDLNVMKPGQQLSGLGAALLAKLPEVMQEADPGVVVVQGDTTTAFIGALCAFYHRVPVAHVEAGLRTHNLDAPYPEEANRKLISSLAQWHFAPTFRARENLLREGVKEGSISVTGNTGVDAFLLTLDSKPPLPPEVEHITGPVILVTGHRRESFGEGIDNLCTALAAIAVRHPEVTIVYPVHLNPNVAEPVREKLGDRRNILLLEPVKYPQMVALLDRCYMVITDSGGIQEEAPALGKPVLVTREATERPEAIEAGCACLVGHQSDSIIGAAELLLADDTRLRRKCFPFGDGHASERIAELLEQSFLRK